MTSKCRSCKYLKIEAELLARCSKGQFDARELIVVNANKQKCPLYRAMPQVSENKYQKMIRANKK